MPKRTTVLLAAVAIAVAGCGGDDDDESPAAQVGDSVADPDESADADDVVRPEVSDDDDITTQILAKIFGLPPNFISDEGRACVSAELAPLFPDGVVPDDVQLTEELATALDDAAETCQVDFRG